MTTSRVRPDGQWLNGPLVTVAEIQQIDTNSVAAVDGDGGGAYTFAGGGAVVEGAGVQIRALAPVYNGAAIATPSGSGVRITLGDNDWPLLKAGHSGQSRTITTPIAAIVNTTPAGGGWAVDNATGGVVATSGVPAGVGSTSWAATTAFAFGAYVVPAAGGGNGMFYRCAQPGTSGSAEPPWPTTVGDSVSDGGVIWTCAGEVHGARGLIPLRVHDGATLVYLTFTFKVGNTHSGGAPAVLPQFRVFSVDASGNRTQLYTGAGQTEGFVSFSPTPASGAAWYASGATQLFTLAVDAGVVIDTTENTYFAEIYDEAGANAQSGNLYYAVAALFGGIADLRPG